MNEQLLNFVEKWLIAVEIGAGTFLGLGLVIFLIYLIKLKGIKSLADKYSFVSKNEKKYLWYACLSLTFTIVFSINGIIAGFVSIGTPYHLYSIAFISIIGGVAVGYSLFALIQFYYPFMLEKRLKHLRYKPRVSPITGKQLRLLKEDEEDVHMTEEMIADEDSFAFDYDVWLDDESGFKIIEKYDGHLHNYLCSQCKLRTLKEYREEIIQQPTHIEAGLVKKYFKCSFCDYKEEKMASVSLVGEIEERPVETE